MQDLVSFEARMSVLDHQSLGLGLGPFSVYGRSGFGVQRLWPEKSESDLSTLTYLDPEHSLQHCVGAALGEKEFQQQTDTH